MFVEPIDGYTFTGRVHRTQPPKIAAPMVFIGASEGSRQVGNAGARYVASFPVWVIYDGANQAQVDGLEEVLGRVHDAALDVGDPVGHINAEPPTARDATYVSTLRGAVFTVDVTVRAHTFCNPPVLQEA